MSTLPTNSNSIEMPDHLYRNGVGIMLINSNKKIFVGKRIDNQSDAWQMPQGGTDVGEDEDLAMYRELLEETGIKSENVKLIKKSNRYFYYNLPYKLQKKFWGGKYLGQKQRWYLVDFIGIDQDVNIATSEPEFSDWKWVDSNNLLNLIVSFKRKLYQEIVTEFSDFL
ncbi:MAG: RNA pyrophosphohydrolase [Alphaproteobacteria bacterium]|nr:RNA pyrophosphohydrolase [Alphaproteobacteria bacterium]